MAGPIKAGDTVKVNYTGRLENGNVFDSSEGRKPLEFTVGNGQLIPGFENAVIGMQEGESKTVTISPEDGYGPHREDFVMDISRNRLGQDIEPEVGMQLQVTDEKGRAIPAFIAAMDETFIKIDANHPLAGQTLIFDIQIQESGN